MHKPGLRLFATSFAGLGLALVACGGGNDVDPRVIPGGGIGDGAIDGEVNVYVIDSETDEPLADAMVHVGSIEGMTDATGLFVASGDLSGPQEITGMKTGYVTQSWIGANGANVTLPLDPTAANAPDVPQGAVSGSIDGWADLTPPTGHGVVAFVGYSFTEQLGDAANEIAQPTGNPPPNVCINLGQGGDCNWTVNARAGTVTIYAFLGDYNPMGTADTSDDVITVNGFAMKQGVQVNDGGTTAGIVLDQIPAANLIAPDLTLPAAPTGTDTVQALIQMKLGTDDVITIPQQPGLVPLVPETSVVAGSSYSVVTLASDSGGSAAQSIAIEHDVASLDNHTVGPLLVLPDGLSADGTTFEFHAVAGATLHTFDIQDSQGDKQWSVAFFDGSTSATLHPHVNLPSGTLTFRVNAIEVDADLTDFSLDDVQDQFTRIAADEVDFTN